MATASAPAAAPSATSPRAASPRAPRCRPSATVVGVAVLLRLVYDPYLNYDARYALLWARDLVHGLKPDYRRTSRPRRTRSRPRVSIARAPVRRRRPTSCCSG